MLDRLVFLHPSTDASAYGVNDAALVRARGDDNDPHVPVSGANLAGKPNAVVPIEVDVKQDNVDATFRECQSRLPGGCHRKCAYSWLGVEPPRQSLGEGAMIV
jgi:hypothetical protein